MSEKFTFFYGGPFSNWLHCDFVVDGIRYSSTEQYMMAEKARLFGDKDAEAEILKTRDPQKAKILGRNVHKFRKDVWEAKARDIVYKGCYAKFQQNKGLLHAMNETKGTTLVEASPTDQIWGIGLDSSSPRAKQRSTWEGANWLGEVLTVVREDLEQGVYRTSNFCWSGIKSIENDVKVTNASGQELWIWDHDKIRRWAFDIKRVHSDVKDVEVIVTENRQSSVPFTEVEIIATKEDSKVTAKSGSKESVLTAFTSALKKVREQLGESDGSST